MKTTYDEQYGTLSFAQRAAYRKFNVSPSDHDTLVDRYGEDAHAAITEAVKRNSPRGMFSYWEMINNS